MTFDATAPRDAGLQPERTALSWNRTGLALAVNAALVLREGFIADSLVLTLLGIALVVIAATAVVYGGVRRRELSRVDVRVRPHPMVMIVAAACVAFSAAGGIAAILVSR